MRNFWNSFLSAATLVMALSISTFGQVTSATIAEKSKTPSNSIPLNATASTASVADCITVEAVLLPKKPAAMLFSGYVAEHFAVIKTTISNHCANQQFILHNIFFDYSDWALSGVYSTPEVCTTASMQSSSQPSQSGSQPSNDTKASIPSSQQTSQSSPQATNANAVSAQASCETWVKSTNPGQVATVGALDVQEEVTEDSVFSKRNLVINGLTLVGQIAGGYAFVGSTAAAQGIGAYNSAFVPNLAKFWPDRRIDQEKFLLALGYRTDQTTVIAKQDHGSYYAFFPIATFLTPTLRKLFLDDPAVFLNPAEAWLEPGAINESGHPANKKDELANLRYLLLTLAKKIDSNLDAPQLLVNLSAPCTNDSTQEKDSAQNNCPICGDDAKCPLKVLAEKKLFGKASLNAARIVVRGVMTIEVQSIPPTIDDVHFDDEQKGQAAWTVTTKATESTPKTLTSKEAGKDDEQEAADKTKQQTPSTPDNNTSNSTSARTGVITGKFLTDGIPKIIDISVPGKQSVTQTNYIVDNTLKAIPEKSTDTSLSFTLNLGQTQMPSGTKLTFQVSRISSNSGSSEVQTPAGSSTTVTSNKFVYTVSYEVSTPSNPTMTKVTIDNDSKTDVWQTPGKLSGTATGTNLTGGTISVPSLEITGKPATVSDYITSIAEVPKMSNATTLDFQLTLVKAVPDGSKISFVIATKQADNTLTSSPYSYVVTKPKTGKQAAGSKPTGHKVPAG